MRVILEFNCDADGSVAELTLQEQMQKLAAVFGIHAASGQLANLLQPGAGVFNEDGTSLVVKENTNARQ